MIVVLRRDVKHDQINVVVAYIEQLGLGAHLIAGQDRTVIGVVGHTQSLPDLKQQLRGLPGVNAVIPITKPYKLTGRDVIPDDTTITVRGVTIGGGHLVVMAGPGAVESEEQLMATATTVKAAGAQVLRGGVYIPHTSPYQFRGLGVEGLKLLKAAADATGMPVITEVLTPADIDVVAQYVDILQIGARNMQNYILLEECGKVGKPVMVQRGMAASLQEWLLAAEYVMSTGCRQVMLCEGGIRTFETATRNTMDVSAISMVKRLSHLPVIADPSNGTGHWFLVEPLALASVAAGADGLVIEVHPSPDQALSDGAQSLTFESFRKMMDQLRPLAEAGGRPLHPPIDGLS